MATRWMAMRKLPLTEYTTTFRVELTSEERDTLRAMVPSLRITPSAGSDGRYDLTPAATVGVLRVGDLQVEISPRLPVERVLFLVSYALDPRSWRPDPITVDRDDHLLEALVPTFAYHLRAALRRGLLHGYRTIDDTHTTIRGRIRFADQLRARPGRPLPVELTYDDFTADILENRLLRSAIDRLLKLPLRHSCTRSTLAGMREQLATVTSSYYRPGRVPEPLWTRLNARYRPAVTIARLILDGAALDVTSGPTTATGVLFDMAAVFENFVVAALRDSLALSARSFPQGGVGRGLYLDRERGIPLKPDLSWWLTDACIFVGDCKYKRATADGVPNADLYQLLAYTTALGLQDGLLVYAAGEHPGGTHTIKFSGKRLHIATLDLAGEPLAVLAEIDSLAQRIGRLADRARPVSTAA